MSRPRISAVAGDVVRLNARFSLAGQPADPYAIRQVQIYRQSVNDANLVETISITDPSDSSYPFPLERVVSTVSSSGFAIGEYVLPLSLLIDVYKPGIYYDVWSFIGLESDLSATTGSGGTSPDLDDQDVWKSQCNKFFVTNGDWYIDDDLCSINLGFEPLHNRFNHPERRYLEVGMMPLPLYDFDYKKVMPILPFLTGTITIETQNCEILVEEAPVSIGLRQGSYRSNPFVLRYMLDTTTFLKGTYRYRITVLLPNGETRTSDYMHFTVR